MTYAFATVATAEGDRAALVVAGTHYRLDRLITGLAAPTLSASPTTQSISSVELYPNPVTDRLLIRSPQSLANHQFQILDSWGRPVASGSAATGAVNVAALKPGVYTLRLSAPGQSPVNQRFSK